MSEIEQPGHPAQENLLAREDPIERIPNLGPIRIRTLNKAGLRTLNDFLPLSAEELSKIPGITPVKAKQILDYIQEHLEKPSPAIKEEPATVAPTNREMLSALAQDLTLRAQELLKGEDSSVLSHGMSHQLARIIILCDLTLHDQVAFRKPRKSVNHLKAMLEMVVSATTQLRDGTIKQSKVSVALRDRRRKLKELCVRKNSESKS